MPWACPTPPGRSCECRGKFGPSVIRGPKTSPKVFKDVAQAARAGRPFHGEMLCYTKDGREVWTDFEMQPLRDEAGVVTGFMSIQLDITERKHAAEELARREAQFRFILNALPVGGLSARPRKPGSTMPCCV
jgi:PAS domain-containing protein